MLVPVVAATPPLLCYDLFSPSFLFFSSQNFGSSMETSPRLLIPTLRLYPLSYGHLAKIALINDASLVTYPQNVLSSLRGVVGLTNRPLHDATALPPLQLRERFLIVRLGIHSQKPSSAQAFASRSAGSVAPRQTSLTKWLNGGSGSTVVAAWRQLDSSVGGSSSTVVAAQQRQRQRLEGGNGSMVVADTAMAEDQGQ
jgi:hypothetical protein